MTLEIETLHLDAELQTYCLRNQGERRVDLGIGTSTNKNKIPLSAKWIASPSPGEGRA